MTMMTMTPAEVRSSIITCFEAKVVPFITSSPGMGKSSIIAQIAQDFSLELIDLRLSQCAPEDLMGLPMRIGEGEDMKAAFAPFAMFPTEKDDLPKGRNGWILLLDEMNSAAKSVQAAAYKIVLDRMVGQAKLHDDVHIVAAGNLMTDRAIVNSLSTAMQSRMVHMEMELSHKDFMDHAIKAGFDSRVLAFLEFQPSKLHVFKPDHNDRTFPCPRTWEFASRLIKDRPYGDISQKLLGGTIGEGVAIEFFTYMKVFENLPSYSSICGDPENTRIPTDPGTIYALIMMLIDRFDRTSFEKAATYVKRLSPEFQVVYFRGINRKDPKFIRDPLFIKMRKDLVNFLYEDDDERVAA